MTAYVTTALQNLLRRPLFPAFARAPLGMPRHAPGDAGTLPPLYRSEGFAEDLLDSHPCH